jgi:hypothetical protein
MGVDLPDDDKWEEHYRVLKATARRDFPAFYRFASQAEADLMDNLVLGRATIIAIMRTPRAQISEPLRQHVKVATDFVAQLFTHFRQAVRACPTLSGLPATERDRIERELFPAGWKARRLRD